MIAILSNADALFLTACVPVVGGIAYNIYQTRAARKAADAVAEVTQKEFKPNGGSSMRDSLDRLEQSVNGLHHRHDDLATRLSAVEDYITNPPKH